MNSDVNVKRCLRQIIGSDYALHDPVRSDLCFLQLKLSDETAVRLSIKNRGLSLGDTSGKEAECISCGKRSMA